MSNIEDETSAETLTISEWQRLSPLSVIFFIGKLLTRLVKDMLPSLAPLGIVIFSSDNKSFVLMLIAIGASGLILLSSFLQYWFFKYKQEGDKVLINDGIFKKNKRVIAFDRIQNINILQPIYFKFFSLVTLQIQTAGAKGNEADLAGIPKLLANNLRNVILEKKSQNPNVQNLAAQNQADDSSVDSSLEQNTEIIASASLIDLIKYGISSNGMFWFFVILAPLMGMLDDILERFFTKEDLQGFLELLGGGVSAKVFAVFFLVFTLLFLMFLFSIIGAIFRYYQYRLTQTKNNSGDHSIMDNLPADITFKRTSGLLTSYEESLKSNKVQSFITKTNFIGKLLAIEHITLGQVSSGNKHQPQKQSVFIIPARTLEQTKSLLNNVFEDSPEKIETQGISKRYINKTIVLKLFLPSLLICLPFIIINKMIWFSLIPFVIPSIFLPLVYRRWKAYRFGMKGGYARFERGLFGYRHVTFPLYKVQRAEVRQSPVQRRRNLATLKIYLASNQLQMQYISFDVANEWLEEINKAIHLDKRPWY